jgi:prepilin-type N-terminal cleavage/methylation domain-containing protein
MMRHRGMTLIELILSLSLLSGLMVVSASWMRIAVRDVPSHAHPVREQACIVAVLDQITRDCQTGDFTTQDGSQPRVVTSGNTLRVRTRSAGRGPVVHTYTQRHASGELWLEIETESKRLERPLLSNLDRFECELIESSTEAGELSRLSVQIIMHSGSEVIREVELP